MKFPWKRSSSLKTGRVAFPDPRLPVLSRSRAPEAYSVRLESLRFSETLLTFKFRDFLASALETAYAYVTLGLGLAHGLFWVCSCAISFSFERDWRCFTHKRLSERVDLYSFGETSVCSGVSFFRTTLTKNTLKFQQVNSMTGDWQRRSSNLSHQSQTAESWSKASISLQAVPCLRNTGLITATSLRSWNSWCNGKTGRIYHKTPEGC